MKMRLSLIYFNVKKCTEQGLTLHKPLGNMHNTINVSVSYRKISSNLNTCSIRFHIRSYRKTTNFLYMIHVLRSLTFCSVEPVMPEISRGFVSWQVDHLYPGTTFRSHMFYVYTPGDGVGVDGVV